MSIKLNFNQLWHGFYDRNFNFFIIYRFPIFFPLKAPVKLSKNDEVELHFWRLNNTKQVWYEWCITKPVAVPIHNPNGRSYTIGL